jgi:hypothetical protein
MKQRRAFLMTILLTGALSISNGCKEDPKPTIIEEPTDTLRNFNVEYDWVHDWDVLVSHSDEYVTDAFGDAKTALWINKDEDLGDLVCEYDSLESYAKLWGDTLEDGKWARTCYMVSLGYVEGLPSGGLFGETAWPGQKGKATVFIFMQRINCYYQNNAKVNAWCVIHELGHGRARLTHLCEQEEDHDSYDCVMSQDKIAWCTNRDVTGKLDFCDKCRDKIRSVRW